LTAFNRVIPTATAVGPAHQFRRTAQTPNPIPDALPTPGTHVLRATDRVVNYYHLGGNPSRRASCEPKGPTVSRDAPSTDHTTGTQAVQAYLLGTLTFDATQALLHRLAYEVTGDPTCAAVILCDHPREITVGREGSRAHVRATRWPVRWVARGGGVVLHAPGQVACYPVLPLDRLRVTPAEYVAGLCTVVGDLLTGFGVKADVEGTTVRVRGRRVAHVGVAVRNWVTSFGLVLNVAPDLELFRDIDSDGDAAPVTSLQRECPTRVRVPAVRQRLLELLARRFDLGRLSVFHHHPTFLPRTPVHALPARRR
jgi:lipoyl(octanoyl) transferase